MATRSQIYKRDNFFGKNNYHNCRNNFVQFNSILNEDEFILQTKNIVSRLTSDNEIEIILAVDSDKGVYIPYRNIIKSACVDETGTTKRIFLVKINRKFFHVKTVNEPFDIEFTEPDNFQSLYYQAEIQNKLKTKCFVA